MTGRGKGGKGLGKGGAKRHRKVLRDNIQVSRLIPIVPCFFQLANVVLFRASPSRPFEDWQEEEESRGSAVSSMKRPEVS